MMTAVQCQVTLTLNLALTLTLTLILTLPPLTFTNTEGRQFWCLLYTTRPEGKVEVGSGARWGSTASHSGSR